VYLGWIESRFKCVWVKLYLGLSAIIKFGVIRLWANQDLTGYRTPVHVGGFFYSLLAMSTSVVMLFGLALLWGYVQHILLLDTLHLYDRSLGPEFIGVSFFSVHKCFYNMVIKYLKVYAYGLYQPFDAKFSTFRFNVSCTI